MNWQHYLVVFHETLTMPSEAVDCYKYRPAQQRPFPAPAYYYDIFGDSLGTYTEFYVSQDNSVWTDSGRYYFAGMTYDTSHTTVRGGQIVYEDGVGWMDDRHRYIIFSMNPETFHPDEDGFITWLGANATLYNLGRVVTLQAARGLYNDLRGRIEEIIGLPAVTEADNGKILTVQDGAWTGTLVATTEETQDIIDEYQGGE